MRHPKQRRVAKDKATGLPKKYLSGIKGAQRTRLAQVTARISRLYQAGKRIPKSLLDEKIRLGRKKK